MIRITQLVLNLLLFVSVSLTAGADGSGVEILATYGFSSLSDRSLAYEVAIRKSYHQPTTNYIVEVATHKNGKVIRIHASYPPIKGFRILFDKKTLKVESSRVAEDIPHPVPSAKLESDDPPASRVNLDLVVITGHRGGLGYFSGGLRSFYK